MLKILWKRGEIAPKEQFLLLSTIFCYLMLYFHVKTRIRFSLRDKRLFEITEVDITRVDISYYAHVKHEHLELGFFQFKRREDALTREGVSHFYFASRLNRGQLLQEILCSPEFSLAGITSEKNHSLGGGGI